MHQCIHSTECYYEVSGRDMFMRSRDVQSQLADGAVLSLTGSSKASCMRDLDMSLANQSCSQKPCPNDVQF